MKTSVKDALTTQVAAVKLGASFNEMAARLRQSWVVSAADVLVVFDRSVRGVVAVRDRLSYPMPTPASPARATDPAIRRPQ
jgi:hypothetical protein